MKQSQRETIRSMFSGHCAYCGCELGERWHVDHIVPVLREGTKFRAQYHKPGNFFPSCPQCNISKGRMDLETWRSWLLGHVKSLNAYHAPYRLSKAFGLITETGIPVKFYFEQFNSEASK